MRNILIVDLYSSSCANCLRSNVDPLALSHTENLGGYSGKSLSAPICGKKYTHVSSNYRGMRERLQEMRPDLEFISNWAEETV